MCSSSLICIRGVVDCALLAGVVRKVSIKFERSLVLETKNHLVKGGFFIARETGITSS